MLFSLARLACGSSWTAGTFSIATWRYWGRIEGHFLRQDAKRTGIEWCWLATRRHANQECSVVPREIVHEPGVYDKPATKAFLGKCDNNVSHSRGVKNKGCKSLCKAALPQDSCAFKERERFGKSRHFWLFSENNTQRCRVSLSRSLYVSDSREGL